MSSLIADEIIGGWRTWWVSSAYEFLLLSFPSSLDLSTGFSLYFVLLYVLSVLSFTYHFLSLFIFVSSRPFLLSFLPCFFFFVVVECYFNWRNTCQYFSFIIFYFLLSFFLAFFSRPSSFLSSSFFDI